MEWTKDQYNKQYEVWVPWLEDLYLRYFTRDNKASYATRDTLSKTKITPIPQANTLQDGVHDLVAGQVGQDGLARPVGDIASREGVNRVERKGRDERGGYVPSSSQYAPAAVTEAGEGVGSAARGAGEAVVGGGEQVAGAVKGGVQGAGGWFGFGGKKTQEGERRE